MHALDVGLVGQHDLTELTGPIGGFLLTDVVAARKLTHSLQFTCAGNAEALCHRSSSTNLRHVYSSFHTLEAPLSFRGAFSLFFNKLFRLAQFCAGFSGAGAAAFSAGAAAGWGALLGWACTPALGDRTITIWRPSMAGF